MNKINDSQQRIIDAIDEMILVDAGPGTGKTTTLVNRYANILKKRPVQPQQILMLTFTNNAAAEMEAKIKKMLIDDFKSGSGDYESYSDKVVAKTFDALCYSIVIDSAEIVGKFFGIEQGMTRSAKLIVNDSVNRQKFQMFFDKFISEHLEDYGDIPTITAHNSGDVLAMIDRLMSLGIVPLKKGWFGYNYKNELYGNESLLSEYIKKKNTPGPSGGEPEIHKEMKKLIDKEDLVEKPHLDPLENIVGSEIVEASVHDDRTILIRFIHDVYHAYIKHSIISNTLTYGLNAIFALTLLYNNQKVREHNSYNYMMIDEFQDTNNSQLMISLMLLSEHHMCCVGDWKQGIYGFRNVSIQNILNFDETVRNIRAFLNDDCERIPFKIPVIEKIQLEFNYRSSQEIVDTAFRCLFLAATDDEKKELKPEVIRAKIGKTLTAQNEDFNGYTEIRYVKAGSLGDETEQVIKAIGDYMTNNAYRICTYNKTTEKYDNRDVKLGDIAVLCTKKESCRLVKDALQSVGIPSFLQGDVDIMSTREGKMCLAWLKYINNENDRGGYIPIMADLGYNMMELGKARDGLIPEHLIEQRKSLFAKKRRITDLLSEIFAFYPDFDPDMVQAIVNALSSEYKSSLQTIPGMISMIEEDMENHTPYPVEVTIDSDAVKIMTMHKAKGLEFGIVIIPFMDSKITPMWKKPDYSVLFQSNSAGLRCTKTIGNFNGFHKICKSWKTSLVKTAQPKNYDEERRLMFVAVSRAQQYITLICGKKEDDGVEAYSKFMTGLLEGACKVYETIPESNFDPTIGLNKTCDKPALPEFTPRKIRIGVHDILNLNFGTDGEKTADEICPKGAKYGIEVHDDARILFKGLDPMDSKPEHEEILRVLDGVKDAKELHSEIECMLPIEEQNVVLKGFIDLLAVYPDHIEIHDYKTDAETSRSIEWEYKLQLSVYAHAAMRFYGLPCKCYLDYVSIKNTVEFEPLEIEEIAARVSDRMTVAEGD